jgi:hypothetical protein
MLMVDDRVLDLVLQKWGSRLLKERLCFVSSVPALSDSQWITSCRLTFLAWEDLKI